ncbi:MAG: DUF4124 domain-containing protein [Pseudomonadota bacterium]
MSWLKLLLRSTVLAFLASVIALIVVGLHNGRQPSSGSQVMSQSNGANHSPVVQPAKLSHGDRHKADRDFLRRYQQILGCGRPKNQQTDPGYLTTAYQWRDEAGVMNFSDQPPELSAAAPTLIESGAREFFITIKAESAALPEALEGSLRAGAKRTYDQWHSWLGQEALVRSHINLRFIGDQQSFNHLYGDAHKSMRAIGFYRMRTNEAVVLYSEPYRALAQATAFHEMSHLITAWHLGPTPPWLNEGIAEYFETLQVQWQGAKFNASRQHLRLLAERGIIDLDELLSLTGDTWATRDAYWHYANAWALVAFLQHSDRGRQTLRAVVREAHATRCDREADIRGPLLTYPGGLSQLHQELSDWVREKNTTQA